MTVPLLLSSKPKVGSSYMEMAFFIILNQCVKIRSNEITSLSPSVSLQFFSELGHYLENSHLPNFGQKEHKSNLERRLSLYFFEILSLSFD